MNTSGYTTIDINGQKVGLKFGLPAIRQIGEYQAKVPFYEGKQYSDIGIAHIIFAGYCCNQLMKMADQELTFEQVYEYVEERIANIDSVTTDLKPVVECFENSKFLKPFAEAEAKPEDTKKKTGTGKK